MSGCRGAECFKPISGVEKMIRKIQAVIAMCIFCLTATAADPANTLNAFPPPDAGMVRHVLQLPVQTDEAAFKVELLVGKTVETDAANRYFFAGRIESESIKGWGYTRYLVPKLGPMAGTLMAVDPSVPKVSRFITLAGEPYLVRYNSRLPIVIYVPDGVEVRYRLWRGDAESKALERG
jgi:ecotin